LFMKQKGN